MPIPRTRDLSGPAVLAYGLRPFFLLSAFYSAIAMLVWLATLSGAVEIPTAFSARDWHVHEMLYGYLAAVIAGYLLASVPNWTGRLPLDGGRLAMLVALWAAGRIAMGTSAWTGWAVAAFVDVSFLTILTLVVLRETLAGQTWRNIKIVIVLAFLCLGNLSFHLEAHFQSSVEYGGRIGTAAVVLLIMLVGGRMVPSFTRNRLAQRGPGPLPTPFDGFDRVSLVIAAIALAGFVIAPHALSSGILLLLAGVAQAVRLGRWAGHRTLGEVHILVLHVAYAFVPLGFLLVGAASLGSGTPASIGIHAFAGGAFGTMTLAVMARVAANHTRRPLLEASILPALYVLVVAAALARLAAGFAEAHTMMLMAASALAWSGAFLGLFILLLGPLTSPKLGSPKPSSVMGPTTDAAAETRSVQTRTTPARPTTGLIDAQSPYEGG